MIDVAAGDKIPRKGGPGIMKSDLLVINKIDLAPMVGASLEVMERDAKKMRGERPFVFTNLKTGEGLGRRRRLYRAPGADAVSALPNDWLALLAVVYALGLKHGMDPDHLATIDGITRSNAARNPRLARWSGLLFSAGHGAIVILVAIGVGLLARQLGDAGVAGRARRLDIDCLPLSRSACSTSTACSPPRR